eukprot:Lankesteria_metandrocarpae@DN2700_c0_g1_i1.p1
MNIEEAQAPSPFVSVGMAACVVLVCQTAVVAVLFLLRVQRQWVRHIEVLIMSLGCWTMIADALMHILPEAVLSLNSTVSTHNEMHRFNVLLGFSAILGATIMLSIEVLVHSVQHTSSDSCGGHHQQLGKHHDHHHHKNMEQDGNDNKLRGHSAADNDCVEREESTPMIGRIAEGSEETRELVKVTTTSKAMYGSNSPDSIDGAATPDVHHHHQSKTGHHKSEHRHRELSDVHSSHGDAHAHAHHQFSQLFEGEDGHRPDSDHNSTADPLKVAAAWSNSAGAAVHNIVDGISIAVAFGGGMRVGLATLICVIVHEIPVQLTGFLLFRKAGFSPFRSLTLNCVVASFIIVGTFSVSFVQTSTVWQACLMSAVAGNFLAISFYMLLREVQDSINAGLTQRSRAILHIINCFGLCMGVGVIALLGLVE